jgi:hypothetical protein
MVGRAGSCKAGNLFDLMVAHVGHERETPEQELAYRSPMLSFSEDPQAALGVAERFGSEPGVLAEKRRSRTFRPSKAEWSMVRWSLDDYHVVGLGVRQGGRAKRRPSLL